MSVSFGHCSTGGLHALRQRIWCGAGSRKRGVTGQEYRRNPAGKRTGLVHAAQGRGEAECRGAGGGRKNGENAPRKCTCDVHQQVRQAFRACFPLREFIEPPHGPSLTVSALQPLLSTGCILLDVFCDSAIVDAWRRLKEGNIEQARKVCSLRRARPAELCLLIVTALERTRGHAHRREPKQRQNSILPRKTGKRNGRREGVRKDASEETWHG